MRKLCRSKIFIIVLTAVICITGSTLAATQILASRISYKNTTVDKALDDLYKTASAKDCFSGDFICTTCHTPEGQSIADFTPNTFVVRWYNTEGLEIIHYYNNELNPDYWYEWEKNSSNVFRAGMGNMNIQTRYIKDSKFTLHDFFFLWLNQKIYYTVCK